MGYSNTVIHLDCTYCYPYRLYKREFFLRWQAFMWSLWKIMLHWFPESMWQHANFQIEYTVHHVYLSCITFKLSLWKHSCREGASNVVIDTSYIINKTPSVCSSTIKIFKRLAEVSLRSTDIGTGTCTEFMEKRRKVLKRAYLLHVCGVKTLPLIIHEVERIVASQGGEQMRAITF